MGHDADPHAELHELAAEGYTEHEPVVFGAEESIEDKVNRINQALTRRINDLRKDFDTTRRAISTSVQTIANDLGSLKTSVENNAESIKAQDKLIEGAGKKADAAKQAVAAIAGRVDQIAQGFLNLAQQVTTLQDAYERHTHPVKIALSGQTDPPAPDGVDLPTPEVAR